MMRWMGCLALLLCSLAAPAQTYNAAPPDGIWWNPAESGRGWTFETQNATTAVLHFQFAPNSRPTFYTSVGTWNGVTRTMIAPLLEPSSGQCVGCPYIPPTLVDLGTMRFVFTSSTRGTAIYPNGVSIPIEKFDFIYADPKAYLKGEWASTWVSSSGSDFSNFIRFTTDCTTCTTPGSVNGQLILTSAGRPALGAPVSVAGIYFVLIDSTTSFYDYYYIIPDANRWTGLACTGLKTSPPLQISQCLGLLYASRTKTQAAAGLAVEPGHAKHAIDESERYRELGNVIGGKTQSELATIFADVDEAAVAAVVADFKRLQQERE